MNFLRNPTRCLLIMALAFAAWASPVRLTVAGKDGFSIGPAVAMAKSGSGKEGDGRSDDNDNDNDNDDDDDNGSGNSGSGNSGSGSSNSGSGSSNSGSGSSNSGSGSSDDSGGSVDQSQVLRMEISTAGIVVTYRNHLIESILNGRYRRVGADGSVIEDRRATGADLSRMRLLVASLRSTQPVEPVEPAEVHPVEVRLRGRDIEVSYSNGWSEGIRSGQYLLFDPYGRRISRRPATVDDRQRLSQIAGR